MGDVSMMPEKRQLADETYIIIDGHKKMKKIAWRTEESYDEETFQLLALSEKCA